MDDSLTAIKKILDAYLGLVFKIGIIITLLSSFFLFTNLTTEFYDTPKFIILFLFTGFSLILLSLKFVALGKVVLVRTPLDLPLLLLLVVAIVSTILSPSPYVSLLGHQLKIHGSLSSILVYVIFYFVLVNNLKSIREVKWILYITLIASQVLAVISLIAYFGVKILPSPWTVPNFTTTGSGFSTTAVLAMLLPFVVTQILSDGKLVTRVINGVFLAVMGVTIALVGTWATWIVSILGLIVTFYLIGPIRQISQISQVTRAQLISLVILVVPVVIVALVAVLSFIPPLGGTKNPFYTQAQSFPREIQLPLITSWKISISAFRDVPFWGTGPATYLFDFTNYKPIEFNSTKTWNIRFDSPFNEYLLALATLGGIGFLALISLTALFITSALRAAIGAGKHPYISALAVSGVAFFALLAMHPGTLVLWVVGLLTLASFMVVTMSGRTQEWGDFSNLDITKAFVKLAANVSAIESSTETIRIDALPGVLFTISLALVLFSLFFGGKFALADYHHRVALNAVSANQGVLAYNELITAEKLNPINDLYRADLAQINFALANSIALSKAPTSPAGGQGGPTEASPGGSLTAQDAQNIQTLLQQSINEAKVATTLSPRSAINWEILALLYRQISGVAQNALVFSLDSYGRSIFQDPLNPVLRLNVGGTYYAIKNYDLAIRFFTDSINLKTDFANGYYNLSVALRDKGDLNSALAAANKMMGLVDAKSSDYKVASDYLNDLKNKISPPVPAQPPAAETSGALQKEELPKVVNVGNPPEKIATPTAVKKPNSTPEPSPQP